MSPMSSLELDASFPLHSLKVGPITYETIEIATQELTGHYLVFAYLQAIERDGFAVIDFAPSCRPSGVRFGTRLSLQEYRPDVSPENMIAAVEKVIGDTVRMPRPVRSEK